MGKEKGEFVKGVRRTSELIRLRKGRDGKRVKDYKYLWVKAGTYKKCKERAQKRERKRIGLPIRECKGRRSAMCR